ncbi:MAG: PAS domain S-box protein [Gammaproteobacteria bacterium]|jgi:PAS domain S-box-containing protein
MTGKPGHEELQQRMQEAEASTARQFDRGNILERLFNLTPDMLCVASHDGYFLLVNAAFETTLGYSRQVLLETPYMEFVHPDDKTATRRAAQQLLAGEALICFENRYRCKDGSYKWLEWTSSPLSEEGLLYAVARDITAQNAMQQELAAQRDLFNNVLSNVPASIFWKDRNSVYLGVNYRFARDAGLQDPQEIIGKTDYDLAWTREQADFYRDCDRKVIDNCEAVLNIEESQRQADGTEIDLLTNKVPLLDASGQVTGMLGVYIDISKRKRAENTLRKSEARLQTLFDSAAEFIFVIDPEGGIIKANRHVCQQSGYREDEVLGSNIKQFFSAESQAVCDCNFPVLRERGYNRADIEFVCKDGHIIQMECSATAVPDEKGEFSTFLIIQRDVTAARHAASALSISEERFRSIFNSSYQLIGMLDPEGTLLDANQTALDFGGLRQEDVVGRPFWETYWWNYSAAVQERLKAAVREAARGKTVGYEEEVLAADKTTRTIEFTLKPVQNAQGETVLIIPEGRDITDRKRAEEESQRHHQEIAHVIRLSTAGEMASGMAHELNQPLTALVSYCGAAMSLLDTQPEPQQQLREILECASEQAQRAGSIIRHLRDFVSKEHNDQQSLEFDQLIKDLDFLLGSELKKAAVKMEYHLHCPGCHITANKVQIEQVLVNLIRNSVEAIQSSPVDDGKVILETRVMDNGSLEVTVTDNGPGIIPDMMTTMFNPFQTSKATGMGMGLSISRSIVEAHGGKLWVDWHRQQGALFGFSLPVFV